MKRKSRGKAGGGGGARAKAPYTPSPPASKWQALFSFEKSGYSITTIVNVASTVLF
jgi:hypothetical protein